MQNEPRHEKSLRLLNELSAAHGPHVLYTQKGAIKSLRDAWWSRFFTEMQEGRLVYLPEEKNFYRFNWSKGVYELVFETALALELSDLIYEVSQTWTDESGTLKSDEGLLRINNAKDLAGAMRFLHGVVEAQNFFAGRDRIVHLANVSLRFSDDGELVAVEVPGENHRTKKRAPHRYDPKARCDVFREKVLSHLPEDSQILTQKYAGQCLLGWNLMQRFLCLVGVGGSSKGTLVEVIRGIVGNEHVRELRTHLLNERFEIGLIKDASLLVGADVGGDFLSTDGAKRIKSLTGNDSLMAEFKNVRKAEQIPGEFNILITSNEEQRINAAGDRRSWERRLLYVPYEKPFEGDIIFGLSKKLLETEGSGIVNWALEGLSLLLQDYRDLKDIYRSDAQKKIVQEILEENDWFLHFIRSRIDLSEKDITTEEILEAFKWFCVEKHRAVPTDRELQRRLPQIMDVIFGAKPHKKIMRHGEEKRGYTGVGWKGGNGAK
jgi:putative DNA primase/helicase